MVNISVSTDTPKKWYKSKTLWVNILTIIGAFAAGQLGDIPLKAEHAMMLVAGVNFALRIVTVLPLEP